VSYVVQPWTAFTICDEPDVPVLPPNPSPELIDKSAGQRLVSPLSQSSMAAIANPELNGWFGLDGLEIDDRTPAGTASSLDIPDANYSWTFGDGTSGTGPSVAHTYGRAGDFTVALTVTDRGGIVDSVSQTVQVEERHGDPPPAPLAGDGQEAAPPAPRRDDDPAAAGRRRQPALRDRRRRPSLDLRAQSPVKRRALRE
jgi:PKD domain-containing protein